MLLPEERRGLASLLNRLSELEVRVFGSPLKGRTWCLIGGATVLAIIGGCLLFSGNPNQADQGGVPDGAVALSRGAKANPLRACAGTATPPDDRVVTEQSASAIVNGRLVGLDAEAQAKEIAAAYRGRWLPASGWGGFVRAPAVRDDASGAWVLDVVEADSGGREVAVIKAVIQDENAALMKARDSVRVHGWICDVTPSSQIRMSRGLAGLRPGVVLVADASIEPP